MGTLLSVIIPIYNTEKYLEKCLKSVSNQTYNELEIICVDDGSTDNSLKIAKEIAKIDKRVIVISQENRGESNARNTGLSIARGDYITFVDCDDYLELKMYEKMMEIIISKQADMVACGYSMDTDDRVNIIKNKLPVKTTEINRRELFEYVYKRDSYRAFTGYIWCKIFDKKIIKSKNNPIWFEEDMKMGGDILFFLKCASRSYKTYYLEDSFYHYYQRITSAVHTKNDLSIWLGGVKAYEKCVEYVLSNHIEEWSVPWLQRFEGYRAAIVAQYAFEAKDSKILKYCQNKMIEIGNVYREYNAENPERIEWFNSILKYKI